VPAVPQKIRSGLVELRTNQDSLYVNPSFWEGLYLLWTFRNFHRLPLQVLNRRQRHLIDKLRRTAVVALEGPVARSRLIGAVENVEAVESKTKAAAAKGKLVTMGAPAAALPKAVGSESTAPNGNHTSPIPGRVTRVPAKHGDGESVLFSFKPQPHALMKATKRQANLLTRVLSYERNRRWLGVGLVVAFGFALLLFRFREQHVVSPVTIPPVAIESRIPSSPIALRTGAADTGKVSPESTPAQRVKMPSTAALQSAPPLSPVEQDRQMKKVVPPERVLTAHPNSIRLPYVAGPPESGFTYPIAPSENLKGSVILNAVIGTEGTVTGVDVLSGNPALAKTATAAVRQWRYAPHRVNGIPVEAETNIEINFSGEDAVSVSFPAK
jgi:TonB family protein